MELAIIFIIGGLFYGLITVINGSKRIPCHNRGTTHTWITRGEADNRYLVCERCRYLPSGDQEEGKNGSGDYDV